MKQTIERFFGWCGLFVTAGSYSSSLLGLMAEPLYVFWGLIIGAILAVWNWRVIETETEEIPGPVPREELKWSIRDRVRSRIAAALAISIVVGAVVIEGSSLIDLADVEELEQFPRYVMAPPLSNDGSPLAAALVTPVQSTQGILNTFDLARIAASDVESTTVTVVKRPRVPWVQIEGISVVVDQWEKVSPPCAAPAGLLIKPPIVYLANITRSIHDGVREFPAVLIQPDDEANGSGGNAVAPSLPGYLARSFASVALIQDGLPQRLLIKVNSEAAGICTYRIRVDFRYLWQRQNWYSEPRKIQFFGGSAEDWLEPTDGQPSCAAPGPSTTSAPQPELETIPAPASPPEAAPVPPQD